MPALFIGGMITDANAQLQVLTTATFTIRNVRHCSNKIISGAEPVTADHFRELAAAGVETVVSVDGAVPRLKLAAQAGLPYVHIPIGYDGISTQAALSLVRVVRETEGKIFVHCHHGKHRGPAAAALACRIEGTADRARAEQILQSAGTSKDYAGLWRDVAGFAPPDANVALPELVESAPVQPLAVQMASVGREMEALEQHRSSGWKDSSVAQYALLIREGLRESLRASADTYSDEFQHQMAASEVSAQKLYESIKAEDFQTVERHYKLLQKSCVKCHQEFRN